MLLSIAFGKPTADIAISAFRQLCYSWGRRGALRQLIEQHKAEIRTMDEDNQNKFIKQEELCKYKMENIDVKKMSLQSFRKILVSVSILILYIDSSQATAISLMGNIGVEILGFAAYKIVADADKNMQEQAWWIQAMYLTIEILPYALGIIACYRQSDYSTLLALGGCAIIAAYNESYGITDTLNHLPVVRGYAGNLMNTPWVGSVEIS